MSASMRARAESEQPELEEDVMSDVLEEPPVSHAPVVKREGGEASNLASSTEEDMKSSLKTTFEELVKWVDEDAGILPPVYNANGLPGTSTLL